jgi:hypothetical protein
MHPGPNAPAKSRFDRLILSNILEWAQQPERQPLPQFSALPGSQRFPEEEMALYWSGDHKIVVTRHPMDDTHIADISAILGYESLIFRTVPSGQPGHSICADLAADERAFTDVIELLDNSPADGPVTVEAFGSTPQYSHLVTIIGKNSRRPVIDRMTPDSYLESSRRLDSKVLAREYFEAARPRCAALRLTRALTVSGGPDLRKHVRHALKALGPVIVKTDFGAGGQAMGIVTSRWLLRRKLSRIVPAGYDGDLLIEEFLGTGDEALSVSYNGLVQDDGTTYSLCAGRHILQAGKYYMGSYLGLGAMPDDCAAQVQSAGEAIGQVAGSIGYRGPLNIDFLYRASDGAIFPLEINPRRSLGASLAEMCISLFGQGYQKSVSAVALHSVPVHPGITSYAGLRDVLLRRGLFGRETTGLVILPYMVSSLALNSNIGLAVVSTDGTPVAAAADEIGAYLSQPGPKATSSTPKLSG